VVTSKALEITRER